jgi:hypothetical protein
MVLDVPVLRQMHNPVYIRFVFLYLHHVVGNLVKRTTSESDTLLPMEEGKRVIGIMAAILASLHMERADDLFGGPQRSPRTDKFIYASVQWAEEIMRKIDNRCANTR